MRDIQKDEKIVFSSGAILFAIAAFVLFINISGDENVSESFSRRPRHQL